MRGLRNSRNAHGDWRIALALEKFLPRIDPAAHVFDVVAVEGGYLVRAQPRGKGRCFLNRVEAVPIDCDAIAKATRSDVERLMALASELLIERLSRPVPRLRNSRKPRRRGPACAISVILC